MSRPHNLAKYWRMIDEFRELLWPGGKRRVDMTALMERLGDKRRPFYDRVHLLVIVDAVDWFTKKNYRGRTLAIMEARPVLLENSTQVIADLMLAARINAHVNKKSVHGLCVYSNKDLLLISKELTDLLSSDDTECTLGVVGMREGVHTDGPINLPAIMDCNIWVCWRLEGEHKVPYRSKGRAHASSTNPDTWDSYTQACARLEASQKWKRPYDGVMFASTGKVTTTDFDHCIADGQIDALALFYIRALDSYSEVSWSDEGVHTIALGTIPRNIHEFVEMYDHAQFIVFTGRHLSGTPTTIENRPEQLAALFAEIAPEENVDFQHFEITGTCSEGDAEVLDKARTNRFTGPKFCRMYDHGDISCHLTHSEADFDLCNMLAYWCKNDMVMVDRLFRRSKLYRGSEVWDAAARKGETYGQGTIKRALYRER